MKTRLQRPVTPQHPVPKPREHKLAYRATRTVKLDAKTVIKAGDDLPRPTTPALLATYEKLISDGAVLKLIDGKPYVERRTHFGPGTIPKIEVFPV